MPPGPAYNWYCVANSVLDILSRTAQIRAAQAETQASRVLRRGARPTSNTETKHKVESLDSSIVIVSAARHTEPLPDVKASNVPKTEEPVELPRLELKVDEETIVFPDPASAVPLASTPPQPSPPEVPRPSTPPQVTPTNTGIEAHASAGSPSSAESPEILPVNFHQICCPIYR